jgi:hypothetical protein
MDILDTLCFPPDRICFMAFGDGFLFLELVLDLTELRTGFVHSGIRLRCEVVHRIM